MLLSTAVVIIMITPLFGAVAPGSAADTHRRQLTKCANDLTNQWS